MAVVASPRSLTLCASLCSLYGVPSRAERQLQNARASCELTSAGQDQGMGSTLGLGFGLGFG